MGLQRHAAAVRGFDWAMRLSGCLQGLLGRMVPPPFRLVQIGSAFWQSRALYVAARLDVATVLADETLAVEAIARRVDADGDALYRLLRMLVAVGVFEECPPRRFRNNRLSQWLREDRPNGVRAMVMMHNDEAMSRPWFEQLERGVRGGEEPFRLVHGEEWVAFMDSHPDFDALFTRAMESVEALVGDAFATDFDWGRFRRLIDLGGSNGAKSLAILKRHPNLRALVVDRPSVIEQAPADWAGCEAPALLERLRFQAGDLIEGAVPVAEEGEIYLLSAVLHGFDDEACRKILGNVASAARAARAPIAVLEMVLPEHGADLTGASFDLQMFVNTRGRERTLAQWDALFERSGVVLEEVVGLRSLGKILLLRPTD